MARNWWLEFYSAMRHDVGRASTLEIWLIHSRLLLSRFYSCQSQQTSIQASSSRFRHFSSLLHRPVLFTSLLDRFSCWTVPTLINYHWMNLKFSLRASRGKSHNINENRSWETVVSCRLIASAAVLSHSVSSRRLLIQLDIEPCRSHCRWIVDM